MKRSAITLLSGGLDSTTATAMALGDYEVGLAITFDYSQRAVAKEIDAARSFCLKFGIEHKVINLPWLADITKTALVDSGILLPESSPDSLDSKAMERARAVWVPNRNGVFIAIAASIAESRGCNSIVAGFNIEEARTFPDNSQTFIDASNEALKLSTLNTVSIVSPTAAMTKEEIARRFVALDLDPAKFWCCYDGGEKLCGCCESCARTIRAFQTAGGWEMIAARFKDR